MNPTRISLFVQWHLLFVLICQKKARSLRKLAKKKKKKKKTKMQLKRSASFFVTFLASFLTFVIPRAPRFASPVLSYREKKRCSECCVCVLVYCCCVPLAIGSFKRHSFSSIDSNQLKHRRLLWRVLIMMMMMFC